jgi:xylose isomerase
MSWVDHRQQARRCTTEELVQHLQTFELELRFSAGVWFFAPGGGRFHDRYTPTLEIPARLEIAARLKDHGLAGIEAHYPNEINEANVEIWKQFMRDTGIRLVTVVPLLFFDSDFEWGSLSSPLPEMRRKAIDRTKRAFKLNRDLDTDIAVVWPRGGR